MLTPLEATLLSAAIYKKLPIVICNDELWELDSEELPFSDYIVDPDEFYARPYINYARKEVVIAIRGTENCANPTAADMLDNIKIKLSGKIPSVFYAVRELIKELLKNLEDNYPGYRVSFCGHSRGGFFSELLAITFKLPTIAIESPGAREIALQWFKASDILEAESLITHYLASKHFLNSAFGSHVGQIFQVDLPMPVISELTAYIAVAFGGYLVGKGLTHSDSNGKSSASPGLVITGASIVAGSVAFYNYEFITSQHSIDNWSNESTTSPQFFTNSKKISNEQFCSERRFYLVATVATAFGAGIAVYQSNNKKEDKNSTYLKTQHGDISNTPRALEHKR